MFNLPNCNFCGKIWKPPINTVADQNFCSNCRDKRRKLATEKFGLRQIEPEEMVGSYLVLTSKLKKNL
jgi:hypothetical protein